MKSFRFKISLFLVGMAVPLSVGAQDRSWQSWGLTGLMKYGPLVLTGALAGRYFSAVNALQQQQEKQYALQLRTKPACPIWTARVRQNLATLGDPDAASTPVYDLPTSEEDINTYGGCCDNRIWLNRKSYTAPSRKGRMKFTAGHEAVHKAKQHQRTTRLVNAAMSSLGAGVYGFVAQSIAQSLVNYATPEKYRAQVPYIQTAVQTVATISAAYVGSWIGNSLYDGLVAIPLRRYHEKQADILGAKVTGAVDIANWYADEMSKEGINFALSPSSEVHGSPMQRYVWFKELAEKEDKDHLVKRPQFSKVVNGIPITFTVDEKKILKNKDEAINEAIQVRMKELEQRQSNP